MAATAEPKKSINDRVVQLEISNTEIFKTLGQMDERTRVVADKTESLHRSIYGYDKTPGMLHDVVTLIEKMDDVKKLAWAILGIVLSIAIGGLYLAVQHAATAAMIIK